MKELLHNKTFIVFAMSVIVFLITELLKVTLIKPFTSKIKNERVKRSVNATILLLAISCGVVLDYLYCTFYLHTAFSIITGLGYGAGAITLYSTIERFFKVKISNPYKTVEGEAIVTCLDEICKDGKLDAKDGDAVKDFWNKVK